MIQNNCSIQSQSYFMNGFLSTITIKDMLIKNVESYSNIFELSSSNVTISNMEVSNLSTTKSGQFILLTLDSEMVMTNLSYVDWSMKLIRVYSSKSAILHSQVMNINTQNDQLMNFYLSKDASITNMTVSNITSQSSRIIDISYSNANIADL